MTKLEGDDFRIQDCYGLPLYENIIGSIHYSNSTYFNWHGRYWVVFISTLISLYDKTIYNVINALIFVAMILLAADYGFLNARKKKCIDFFAIAFAFSMMWIFVPSVYDVFLWLSGSIGYMWTATAILFFGGYYFKRFLEVGDGIQKENKDTSAIKVILMITLFLGGVIAGCSSEPGSCTLMLALAMYVIYALKKHHKIKAWEISGIIGSLLGFAILMFAPGNLVRAATVDIPSEQGGLIIKYGYRIFREFYYSLIYLSIPLGIYVFLLIVRKNRETALLSFCSENIDSCILVFLALVSVAVMTFSAGFSTRIFMFPILLITVACLREYSKMGGCENVIFAFRCLTLFMLAFTLISMAFSIKEFDSNNHRIERSMYTNVFYVEQNSNE